MLRAATFLAVVLCLRSTSAQENFPYRARITHAATLVRSGPGESLYPTSRLLQGAEVEVHRHDGNGWCAIRPPEGEFSLIAADRVKLLPGDDLAEVVGQEAPVWIGSHVAKPDEHRWQLHLQPGERALVLGVRAAEASENGPTTAWYKIAPPAGEFRWVWREALTRIDETATAEPPGEIPMPELLETATISDARPLSRDEASRSKILPAPVGGEAAVVQVADQSASWDQGVENAEETGAVAQASYEAPSESDMRAPQVNPSESVQETVADVETTSAAVVDPAFIEADRRIAPTPRSVDQPAPPQQPGVVADLGESFEAEVAAIHLELTLAVAQDLSLWRLGPLRDRTLRLRENAPSSESRRRAEALLQSIQRFEQLYARYRQFAEGSRTALRPR